MTLTEIIEDKKNDLSKEVSTLERATKESPEEIRKLKEEIYKVTEMLNVLQDDIYRIEELNEEDILNYIDNFDEGIKEKIRLMKITARAVKKGLDVDLTTEERALLQDIISHLQTKKDDLKDFLSSLTSKVRAYNDLYERAYLNYQELETILEKLKDPSNGEKLTEAEFNILYSNIIEDTLISNEVKKELLIQIKLYNLNGKRKTEVSVKKASFEEIQDLLREYSVQDKTIKRASSFKSELTSNININNAREILDFMSSTKIDGNIKLLSKFTSEALLAILSYGTLSSVKNRFEVLERESLLNDFFFDTPSAWIDNLKTKKTRQRNNKDKETLSSVRTLNYFAHVSSYEDIMTNYEYLKGEGVDISFKDAISKRILTMNSETIKRNTNIINFYGLSKVPSLYLISYLDEKCDKFSELELLSGPEAKHKIYSNAVATFPTILAKTPEEIFMLLYREKRALSKNDFYRRIFSESRQGNFKTYLTRDKLGYKLKTSQDIETFFASEFIDPSQEIPNYIAYAKALSENKSFEYDKNILLLPEIIELEDYKDENNSLIYRFGSEAISVHKVLSNYSALQKSGIPLDKNALMFCICEGSYLNEEAFNMISDIIGFKEERNLN